jgi:uncharacterized membrane protein YfcA
MSHIGMHLIICVASLITSTISGMFGMAGGMILMGVLGALLSVNQAMLTHGFIQLVANGSRFLTLWRSTYWRGVLFYLVGAAISSAVLLTISLQPSKFSLYLVLGCIPFTTLLPVGGRFSFENPVHALFCGMSTLVFQLTSGVSGPFLDTFFINVKMDRYQIVATKALTQSLSHLIKIFYFGRLANITGLQNEIPIWWMLSFAIAALLGTQLGVFVLSKLTDKNFIKVSRMIILITGIIYLYKAYTLF